MSDPQDAQPSVTDVAEQLEPSASPAKKRRFLDIFQWLNRERIVTLLYIVYLVVLYNSSGPVESEVLADADTSWSPWFKMAIATFLWIFIGGYETIPPVHAGLYIIAGNRLKIAAFEGPRWRIPIFTKFEVTSYIKRTIKVPRSDFYTKPGDDFYVLLSIGVVYRVGVVRNERWGYLRGFFVRAERLYAYEEVKYKDVVLMLQMLACEAALSVFQHSTRLELFGGNPDTDEMPAGGDASQHTLWKDSKGVARMRLSKLICVTLDDIAAKLGIDIVEVMIYDLDYHAETAKAIKARQLARLNAEALEEMYEILGRIAQKLSDASKGRIDAGTALLKLQELDVLKVAAQGGLAGLMAALSSIKLSDLIPSAEGQTAPPSPGS